MQFISYAQNFEDVMLWRAFKEVSAGFYIDVGGFDPVVDSVTQAFYERGWSGINIEPVPSLAKKFNEARPRDVNLMLAVSDCIGTTQLHEIQETGLSTLDAHSAHRHSNLGRKVVEHVLETTTLADVCSKHVKGDIHFLKVDVEGAETAVLRGMDFNKWRPWIVLVEATLPNSTEPSHSDWEPILFAHQYEFLWFDGLNRFYASREKAGEMRQYFLCPPNPFDHYRLHRELVLLQQVEQRQMETKARIEAKITRLKEKNDRSKREDKSKIAALQDLLRHHQSNPLRALALWWNHKKS
jgi:FkbM family methyltransferase